MKKLFLVVLCAGFVVFSVSGNVSALNVTDVINDSDPAAYIGGADDNWSGQYLFTVDTSKDSGNPPNDNIWQWSTVEQEALRDEIEKAIGEEVFLTLYGKYDFGEDGGFEESGVEFTFTITETKGDGDDAEPLAGTWSTDIDGVAGPAVDFYTVKGSGSWALYWLGADGASEGLWSTVHLLGNNDNNNNIPAISHLSLWNPEDGDTPPVPEPSTVFLLGIGLLGVLGLGRKIKK